MKILILSAVTNSCGSGFKREYAEESPVSSCDVFEECL